MTGAFAAMLAMLFLQAQPASIEGIVVKLGTNDPIAGVTVDLSRNAAAAATVTTGNDGRFVFPEVAPGTNYRIVATRSDSTYTPAEYGQRTPGGPGLSMTITAGQRIINARLEMAATGSISGRVFDEGGEPVVNARVMALNTIYRDGRKVLNVIQAVRTNDIGEYRLFWLTPGRYYIGVVPQDLRSPAFAYYVTTPGRYGSREDASSPVIVRRTLDGGETIEETWVPIYYGGGRDMARALPVDLGPAAIVGAVDIPLNNARVRSRRIRGVVINGMTGQPAANAHIRAVPRNPAPHVILPNAESDKAGAFDIGGLVPGSYFLVAAANSRRGTGGGETIFDVAAGAAAVIPLEIGERDIENITVTVTNTYRLPGKIVIEQVGTTLDLARARVRLARDPDLLGMPNAAPVFTETIGGGNGVPSADGTFTLLGFTAGTYRVSVSPWPENTFVKAIRLGTADVLADGLQVDGPPQGTLEIVLGTNPATLDGTITNSERHPVPNAVAVLAPVDSPERADLIKTTLSDGEGRFRIRGITPGEYEAFAWEVVDRDAWLNPEFMAGFKSKGQRVRLADGATANLNIMVIP